MHLLTDVQNNFSDTDPAYSLFNVTHTSTKPFLVTVELNQAPVDMEVDTGASVSLIRTINCGQLWQQPHLYKNVTFSFRPTQVNI